MQQDTYNHGIIKAAARLHVSDDSIYLVNLADLPLVLATDHNNCVTASHVHIMPDWLLVVVQLIVLPSLSRALHEVFSLSLPSGNYRSCALDLSSFWQPQIQQENQEVQLWGKLTMIPAWTGPVERRCICKTARRLEQTKLLDVVVLSRGMRSHSVRAALKGGWAA